MSIILNLPQDLETELAAEAQQLGLPLSEYVLRVLALGRTVGKTFKTGAELVAYWRHEGLIGTRPDIVDSQTHARHLRKQAEQRVRS